MNSKDINITCGHCTVSLHGLETYATSCLVDIVRNEVLYKAISTDNIVNFTEEMFWNCANKAEQFVLTQRNRNWGYFDELDRFKNKGVKDFLSLSPFKEFINARYPFKLLNTYNNADYEEFYSLVIVNERIIKGLLKYHNLTLLTPAEHQTLIDKRLRINQYIEDVQLILNKNIQPFLEKCFKSVKALPEITILAKQ